MNNIIAVEKINDNVFCPVINDKEIIKESYLKYLSDESKITGQMPDSIWFPTSTEETAKAIKIINQKKQKATISGSRTGITGGASSFNAENIISLENLKSSPKVYYDKGTNNWVLQVSAKAKLSEIMEILKLKKYSCDNPPEQKLFYPVDPTETSASIGGMISTNASGARTLFYGPTRKWVHGLTVVLSDGSVIEIKRGLNFFAGNKVIIKNSDNERTIEIEEIKTPVTKHAAGYYLKNQMDLIDLFIGQEGTLGIITHAELKLMEINGDFLYLTIFINNNNYISLIKDLKNAVNFKPLAIEFFDDNSIRLLNQYRNEMLEASSVPKLPDNIKSAVYTEINYKKEDFNKLYAELNRILKKNRLDINNTWAGFTVKHLDDMKRFRHALPERINSLIALKKIRIKELTKIGTDMAVPDKYLKKLMSYYTNNLKKYKLDHYIFGHIGNAHLHVNIIPENMGELKIAKELYKKFAEKVVTFNGSVSAEHGIGRLKKEFLKLQYSEKEIAVMKKVKTILDPHNLLNPGVLF
ncbi:MAG: FAD-binding oxidoreductase [Spirochaetes bacterium]|nr:FAD-binding oxidoreductase [Spirochaetota bacterium]